MTSSVSLRAGEPGIMREVRALLGTDNGGPDDWVPYGDDGDGEQHVMHLWHVTLIANEGGDDRKFVYGKCEDPSAVLAQLAIFERNAADMGCLIAASECKSTVTDRGPDGAVRTWPERLLSKSVLIRLGNVKIEMWIGACAGINDNCTGVFDVRTGYEVEYDD